jgi:carboxypeptidase C (cathepsin A)
MKKHPEYSQQDFYIFGESYAGTVQEIFQTFQENISHGWLPQF